MPQPVNITGFGTVEFPDAWSQDQISSYVDSSPEFAPIRASLAGPRGSKERRNVALAEQPRLAAEAKATDQPGWLDTLSDIAASTGRGAASMIRAPVAAVGGIERANIDALNKLAGVVGLPQLPDSFPRPFEGISDAMKQGIEGAFPLTPQAGQSIPSMVGMAAGSGIGSMVGLLGPGLLGLPAKGVQALGATAEGVDAYEQELNRQGGAGEPRSYQKALLKGVGYGALTYPIEKFGAPRLLERAAERSTRTGIIPALRKGALEAGVNAAQESAESVLQGLIVNGKIDPQDVALSAIGGAFAGGPFGFASEFTAQGNAKELAERHSALKQSSPVAADALAVVVGASQDQSLPERFLQQVKLAGAGPSETDRVLELLSYGKSLTEGKSETPKEVPDSVNKTQTAEVSSEPQAVSIPEIKSIPAGAPPDAIPVPEPTTPTEPIPNDLKTKRRLRGEKPQGKKPGRAVPVQEAGSETPTAGGVLQAPSQPAAEAVTGFTADELNDAISGPTQAAAPVVVPSTPRAPAVRKLRGAAPKAKPTSRGVKTAAAKIVEMADAPALAAPVAEKPAPSPEAQIAIVSKRSGLDIEMLRRASNLLYNTFDQTTRVLENRATTAANLATLTGMAPSEAKAFIAELQAQGGSSLSRGQLAEFVAVKRNPKFSIERAKFSQSRRASTMEDVSLRDPEMTSKVESVLRMLAKKFNKKIKFIDVKELESRLRQGGVAMDRPGNVEGFYYGPYDTLTFIPESIQDEAQAERAFLHEMTHGNLAYLPTTPEGAAELDLIFSRAKDAIIAGALPALQAKGYNSIEELAKEYKFDLNTPEGMRELLGELTARFAETVDHANPPGWFGRMLTALRMWLAKRFGIDLGEGGVARWLAGLWREGGSGAQVPGVQFSKTIFRSPEQLQQAMDRPGVEPAQQTTLHEQAAAQRGMFAEPILQLVEGWNNPDGPVREKMAYAILKPILGMATAAQTSTPINSLPIPEQGAASRMVMEVKGAVDNRRAFTQSKFDVAKANLDKAVLAIPHFQQAAAAAAYHDRVRRELPMEYQRYLVNQARGGNAPQSAKAEAERLLQLSATKANKTLIDPDTAVRLLSDMAADPRIVAVPGTKNADIVAQANQLGGWTGADPDSLIYLLNGGPGGLGSALSRIPNLARKIELLRAFRDEGEGSLRQAFQFASDFSKKGAATGNVTPGEFARRLASHIAAHRAEADVAQELFSDLDKWINRTSAYGLALQALDEIATSPEFQSQVTQAAGKTDAIDGGMWVLQPATGSYVFTGPISGSSLNLKFPTEGTETADAEFTKNIRIAADELRQFLATPNIDTIQKRTAERFLQEMTIRWLDVALPPRKNILKGRELARLARRIPWFKIPQSLISEVGGRTAAHAQRMALSLDFVHRHMARIAANKVYGDAAFLNATAKAIIARRSDKGPAITPQELLAYVTNIYNPLLASRQNYGGNLLKVGKFTKGQEIIADDMRVMELQKLHDDEVRKVAEDYQAKFGSPTRIEENIGKQSIRRKAVAAGPDVVPRTYSAEARALGLDWSEWSEAKKRDYLWGSQDNFEDRIIPFVIEMNPEFHFGTKYDSALHKLAVDISNGKSVTTRAELFDEVAAIVSKSNPNFDRTAFDADLFNELNTKINESLNNLARETHSERAAIESATATPVVLAGQDTFTGDARSVSKMLMNSLRTEGSFVNPRGKMVAPSNFYQYARVTPASRDGLRSNAKNIANVNFMEAMESMVAAMENSKRHIIEYLDSKLGPGLSIKEREKASRKEKDLGRIRFGLAELTETIGDFRTMVGHLRQSMNREVVEADRAMVSLARSTNQFLQLNLLGSFGSQWTNFIGGNLLGQQIMDSQIGRMRDAILLGGLRNSAKMLPQLLSFALNQAKASKHWSYQIMKPFEQTMRAVMPSIGDSIDRQSRMMDRLRRQDGSALNSDFDFVGRAEARKHFGSLGAYLPGREFDEPVSRIERTARRITNNRYYDLFQRYVPRSVDHAINTVRALNDAQFITDLESYADRIRLSRPGVLDASDESQEIKPEEIERGQTQMHNLKEYLRPIGGFEHLMFDFIRRREAAPPDQRKDVHLLTDEQLDTWLQTTAQLGNAIGNTNAPSWKNTGIGPQIMMTFMSWGSQAADQIMKSMAYMGTPGGGSDWKRQLALLLFSIMTVGLLSIPFYELKHTINGWFTGKTPSQTRLANVIGEPLSWDAIKYGLVSTASIVPFMGNVVERAFGGGSSRPIMDLTQIVPLLGFMAGVGDSAIRAWHGDVLGSIGDFANRWVPISQPVLSRLPFFSNQAEIQNALRSGRAAAPLDFEKRRPGGNTTPSPQAGTYRAIEGAAYAGDVGKVKELFTGAVEKQMRLRGVDRAEAQRQVESALKSRTVETRLFPRKLTDAERQRWESRMTTSQAGDIAKARAAEQLISTAVLRGTGTGTRSARARTGAIPPIRKLKPLKVRPLKALRPLRPGQGRRLRGASAPRSRRSSVRGLASQLPSLRFAGPAGV